MTDWSDTIERIRVATHEHPRAGSHTEWARRLSAILDEDLAQLRAGLIAAMEAAEALPIASAPGQHGGVEYAEGEYWGRIDGIDKALAAIDQLRPSSSCWRCGAGPYPVRPECIAKTCTPIARTINVHVDPPAAPMNVTTRPQDWAQPARDLLFPPGHLER